MTDHEEDAVPLLRLWIGYHGAPDARETGQIIERLANAYTQTVPRTGGRPARLAVEHLRIGSLLVDLKAAFETGAAVVGIIEQRELLVGFVQRVALTIQAARDASLGIDISPSVRNFLYSFVKPVATGRASYAQLRVEGDNNVVIVINSDNARALDSVLERLMPARGGGGSGGAYMRDPPLGAVSAPEADAADSAYWDRLEKAVHAQNARDRIRDPARRPHIFGASAVFINGAWYARPEGYNGILIPVSGAMPSDIPASMQKDLALAGTVQVENGKPVSFNVESFVYVGDGQASTS